MKKEKRQTTMQSQGALSQSGEILLISCYELGHQPIGIARPLGFMQQAGYSPATLDLAVEEFDAGRIQDAKFIGISVPMHTALTLGVQVAGRIRTINPLAHISFYGLYASLNAPYLLEYVADSVIGGEYETPLVNLVNRLAHTELIDSTRKNDLNGVSLKGDIVAPSLNRLTWHIPSNEGPQSSGFSFLKLQRSQLPELEHYAQLEQNGQQRLVGYVEGSRGCLHYCRHCPIVPVYRGRFFLVPEEMVLADIREQVERGATHITFGDPDFLNGPGHSIKIIRALHDEFPRVTFDFTTKIEHILKHGYLFQELGDRGGLFVISAVESFSDIVLSHLNKGHTRDDIFQAFDITRAAGIVLRPSLVAFTPWTTFDDYIEMFDLVRYHHLIDSIDPVQFTIRLLVPPHSELLDSPETQKAPMQNFVQSLDEAKFQYTWVHPDPRMDQLHQAIAQTVEQAAQTSEDHAQTFYRLWGLAHEAAGLAPPPHFPSPSSNRTKPPRLTEPWFCCAEPTQIQLQVVQANPNCPK